LHSDKRENARLWAGLDTHVPLRFTATGQGLLPLLESPLPLRLFGEDAIASFDKALEFQSNNFIYWHYRGFALHKIQKHDVALTSFEKALEINPNNELAWYWRGSTLVFLEKYELAIKSFEKTIELKSNHFESWFSGGLCLNDLKIYEQAVASYNKAIEIKPDHISAWNNRGSALDILRRCEEAIASYEQLLKFKPDYYTAWYNRGVALVNLEQHEEAIASYDKAIKIKPDYHNAWNNRGVALVDLVRYDEAVASYDKAIEIKPDYHEAWNNRGVVLVKLGQYEEAIASYDKALEIKPEDYNTWINRGLAISNIVEISHSFILPVITSYPDLTITFKNPDLNEGGKQGLFASYEEGLKHCPQETHPEGWGKLHRAIGNAHYTYGRKDENPYPQWRRAFRSYQTALKTLTQFPEAHLELLQDFIRCLSALGQTSEAEELQRRATDILQNLLENTPSPARKQQLALRFAGFQQLTVDLAIQSGNWCAALELAEKGKNACLTWLLYSLGDEISSPTYSEIQKLLNPTTAIAYWHISPNALNRPVRKLNSRKDRI
jgi:tetratricopeptide (TPR) repeat protein